MKEFDCRAGDILIFKKPHPCGETRWEVLRSGADLKLRCKGCGHEIMIERWKAEKRIRAIEKQP